MDIKKKWGLEICEVIPCIWLHVICRMQNVAYQCNGYKLLHRASLFTHSTQHKLINLLYGSSVSDIYEQMKVRGIYVFHAIVAVVLRPISKGCHNLKYEMPNFSQDVGSYSSSIICHHHWLGRINLHTFMVM